MTTLRRQRPRWTMRQASRLGTAWLCLAVAAAPAVLLRQAGHAATTEQIVVDHKSGLAIFGYDPVAYFTDRSPRLGRADFELKLAGVAWRFRNAGNREAFSGNPDIYMPQYGGHDPVAVANGVARPGHPDFWAIHSDRLFLFYSDDARIAFEADPEQVALQAEANWPRVSRTLVP